MKLSTHFYQRLLWITASASLLGIVGCSNLPRTASSNDTAKYGTNGRNLVSIIGLSPTGSDPDPYMDRFTAGGPTSVASNATAASSSTTSSSSTSSGGNSGAK